METCKNCGKSFPQNQQGTKKYCNVYCRVKYNRKIKAKVSFVRCPSCGDKLFLTRKHY